jgi:succinyl-CoA synthetase beta subunit
VDLYEYQGKELFARFGIPVSDGRVATTPEEARAAAEEIGGQVVVKAQVLTGGRGKAGGVKLAEDPADAEAKARDILGLDIRGHVVKKLWIEKASDIAKEYYLSITFDRGEKKPLFMLTTEGGVEIEEVAESNPDALSRLHIDPLEGFQAWQARRLIYGARIEDPGEQKQILAIIGRLYEAFVACDAMLCEINPLIVTPEGEVRALDSKFTVDDNALYKHEDIAAMRDLDEEDPAEVEASKHGLSYISLDGNIGCLVNGAGLAMATMDTIKLFGGEPANFLDVGGGATTEKVTEAFKLMLRNPNLRAILVNIFGGIMKCDVIATGVVEAARQVKLGVPLVVRMKGTNEDLGRKILADSGLPIISANNMAEAAQKVVMAAKGKN